MFGPGNAQLPLPPMLMFNRITDISETGGPNDKGFMSAPNSTSRRTSGSFPCHFIGDPGHARLPRPRRHVAIDRFLPRLARARPARAAHISTGEVKFTGMVTPKTKLVEYGIDFKRVMRGRLVLGIADGWMKADGETIYEATDLRVGLFQEEGRLNRGRSPHGSNRRKGHLT